MSSRAGSTSTATSSSPENTARTGSRDKEKKREKRQQQLDIARSREREDARQETPPGDYLLSICNRLYNHASKLPDTVVSKNNDCYHYARITDLFGKLYRVMGCCIRHWVYQQPWNTAVEVMEAKGDRPPTAQLIHLARKFLIKSLLEHGDRMRENYRISGKNNRLCDVFAMCIFTLDMIEFYQKSSQERARIAAFIADEDEWLVEHNVAIASDANTDSEYKTPVLGYRMSQLAKALYQLAASWGTAPYSIKLVHYMELLRIRIGQMLNFSFSGMVHDIDALRVPVDVEAAKVDPVARPDSEYQASPLLLETVAPVMTEMMRCMVTYSAHVHASDRELAQVRGKKNFRFLIKNFGAWINRNIQVMIPEGASEYMGKYLLEMNLRPGERQVYSREFPSGTNLTDVQFILGAYRKIEFNYLSELKQKTFAQVIEKELPKQIRVTRPGRVGYESKHLVLCLVELIEMYTKAKYFMRINLLDFVIFEVDLEKRATDFRYVEEPMMVQVFNYFQLYYKNKLYRFDSFILSFLAWLKVIEKDFQRCLRGCNLSLWYSEILGLPEGDRTPFWEPPSLFGSDDEAESSSDEDTDSKSTRSSISSSSAAIRTQPSSSSSQTQAPDLDQELVALAQARRKTQKKKKQEVILDPLSVKTAL